MAKIIMFLMESIVISTLLFMLYKALFRGKASYFAQRVLLLSIPIVATLSALISFDFIELRGVSGEVLEEIVASDTTEDESPQITRESISPEGFKVIRSEERIFGVGSITLYIWAIITAILLTIFLWRLSRIILLRRAATMERHSDYSIYRLWGGDIIFSFWRGVYISKEMDGDRLNFVMRHELEHIRRYHYIDKSIAEIYAILLWFNPIVRRIQQEISLIHEYEADHAVIESGCDLKSYKMFIFEEMTTYVPTFANGINSSQIKRRFITMDKSYRVSHRVLRVLLSTVAFVAIAATSMVYVDAKEINSGILNGIPSESIESVSIKGGRVIITKKDGSVVNYEPDESENIRSINANSGVLTITTRDGSMAEYKLDQLEANTSSRVQVAPSIDAKREQIYIADRNVNSNDPIYVVRCEDHTKVYIGAWIIWNQHWVTLSEQMYLTDPKSGDKYMLHSSGSGLPLEQVIWIKNQKDEYIYFELIFPPLDKGVKRVDLTEWTKASTTAGYTNRRLDVDGIGWHFTDVKVGNKLPYFASAGYQAEHDREPRVIELEKDFEPR